MAAPDPQDPATLEARAAELILRLAALGLILYGAYALLRPFLALFLWAVILATALKPLHGWLSTRLGGRQRLAAGVLTLVLLVVAVGPVAALADNLIVSVKAVAGRMDQGALRVPALPPALADLPMVGPKLAAFWTSATSNLEATVQRYAPMIMPSAGEVIGVLGGVAKGVLGFFFAIVLTGVLLATSDGLSEIGRRLADRLAGSPVGTHVIGLAVQTIRGVSRGVVGVAVLQALLAGIVIQAFGIPGAGVMAFVGLILCIVQIGLFPIVVPLLIWAWVTMAPGMALLLTVLLVPILLLDNVLKPLLMSRGLETPAAILLVGVIGGTMSAGLVGVFVGPIVLAVLHDLAQEWIADKDGPREA